MLTSVNASGDRDVLLMMLVGSSPTPRGATVHITFRNVRTPLYAQQTTQFDMWTMTPDLADIDLFRHTAEPLALPIAPNAILSAAVGVEAAETGALTAVSFSFVLHNAVPYQGKVCIDFPPDFRFYGPSSGFGFGGRASATSQQLGDGLVVERYGGDAQSSSDDHRICVVRFGAPTDSARGLVTLHVTNVIVPLDISPEGRTGNFTIVTRTAAGELIDVLTTPVSARLVEGRYAPSPPLGAHGELSAAPPGRRQRASGWMLLLTACVSVACSLWLRVDR